MTDILTQSKYSQFIHIFFKSAAHAGKEILAIYNEGDFNVKLKEDSSPLTIADVASHTVIRKELSRIFPDVPQMSEEGKSIPYAERKHWDMYFCIDPLDGTKEFIKRNGEFTINLALIKNQRPVVGVVYIPVKDILYIGGIDIGSYKIHNFSDTYTESSSFTSLNKSIEKLPSSNEKNVFTVIGSRSHMNKETESYIHKLKKKYNKLNIISAGSSLKFCLIAEGTANLYPRFAPTMEWDTAAGQAIVEGIGGCVTDYKNGNVLTYNKLHLTNPSFIVRSVDYEIE